MRTILYVLAEIGSVMMRGRRFDKFCSWVMAIATVFVVTQCLLAAILGRLHVR